MLGGGGRRPICCCVFGYQGSGGFDRACFLVGIGVEGGGEEERIQWSNRRLSVGSAGTYGTGHDYFGQENG